MTFLRKLLQKRGGLLLRVAGGLILGGMMLGGGGLIYCGIMSHTARELPKPGGPYAIGRTVFDWVDQARTETFVHKPGIKRELMVWVWYPAQSGASKEAASYLPSKWAQDWDQYHGGPLFGDWLISRAETILAHAFENVPLATNQARYPVLIFSPGMGLLPADYTTLILASTWMETSLAMLCSKGLQSHSSLCIMVLQTIVTTAKTCLRKLALY